MKKIKFILGCLVTFFIMSTQACQKDNIVQTPRAMSIIGIDILQYPMSKPSGGGWDFTTGPDIFVTLSQGTSSSYNDAITGTYSNATGSAFNYTLNNPYTINNLSTNWSLGIFDNDAFDPDDFMGGIYFLPENYQSNLPNSILLSLNDIQFRVFVTWNF